MPLPLYGLPHSLERYRNTNQLRFSLQGYLFPHDLELHLLKSLVHVHIVQSLQPLVSQYHIRTAELQGQEIRLHRVFLELQSDFLADSLALYCYSVPGQDPIPIGLHQGYPQAPDHLVGNEIVRRPAIYHYHYLHFSYKPSEFHGTRGRNPHQRIQGQLHHLGDLMTTFSLRHLLVFFQIQLHPIVLDHQQPERSFWTEVTAMVLLVITVTQIIRSSLCDLRRGQVPKWGYNLIVRVRVSRINLPKRCRWFK